MELHYPDSNNASFIEAFAACLNVKAKDNLVTIPEQFGSGYAFTVNVFNDISVLLYDMRLNTELLPDRKPNPQQQHFTLQLNDAEVNEGHDKNQPYDFDDILYLGQSLVMLSNSFNAVKSYLPPNTRIKGIKIVFTKDHLLEFLDITTVENFLNTNFSHYFKKNYIEPVNADYRLLMTEVLREAGTHPLKHIFIRNRVMLLLESFLQSFIKKHPLNKKALQLKDDVIIRLVKAEALLVKNFADPPLTIDKLAKVSAMSATKFKHDFKQLYGLPFYEYYQKNRMMHARALILEAKFAIKEVGLMVGYSNLGHFAASFKKEFGILPSELMSANRVSDYVPTDAETSGKG